jgi:trehalose 6-phosphate synthase/phosphatase
VKSCSSNFKISIVLWPLFHYIMWNDATDGRREAREWKAYHHVNQQFANAVIENYHKDDISKCRFCVISTPNSASIGVGQAVCTMCYLRPTTHIILSCLAVWVHDYHLLLLPGMIRERIPDAKIGLFVHAPFPSSEIFRCLPSTCQPSNFYRITE